LLVFHSRILFLSARGQRQGVDLKTAGNRECHSLQRALSIKLAQFIHVDVFYTLKRLHAADMKHIYLGPNAGQFRHPVKMKRVFIGQISLPFN
jgi:hypothetical protein